jgi:hypothetical protein
MTTQTSVAVYAVGDGGTTGQRLGAGALVDPEYVLVYAPLNQQLASGAHPLRVGLFAADPEVGEVIDVAEIRVIPDATDLVLLRLTVLSSAPVHGLPVVIADDPLGFPPVLDPGRPVLIAAARRVLAEAPPPAPIRIPEQTVEDPVRWLLHLFGNG